MTDFQITFVGTVLEKNSSVFNNLNLKNMSVNFKPLADRILVEPTAAETTTASGIIIPDTAKEKPQEGIVVAVGPGKKDEPTSKTNKNIYYRR